MQERDANGRFVKGNGGGPGRPSKREEERYRELLKEAVSYAQWKRIIQKLAEKAGNGDVQATKLLFEYILGKPPQRLQHSGEVGLNLGEWKQKTQKHCDSVKQMEEPECGTSDAQS